MRMDMLIFYIKLEELLIRNDLYIHKKVGKTIVIRKTLNERKTLVVLTLLFKIYVVDQYWKSRDSMNMKVLYCRHNNELAHPLI